VMDIFGLEVAQRLYPQLRLVETEPDDVGFICLLEQRLLTDISEAGYSKRGSLAEAMICAYDRRTWTYNRVARALPGLMEKHVLKEKTCNKALKESFKMTDRGYPRIIVPKGLV